MMRIINSKMLFTFIVIVAEKISK